MDDAAYTNELLLTYPGLAAHLRRTWRRPFEVGDRVTWTNVGEGHGGGAVVGSTDEWGHVPVQFDGADRPIHPHRSQLRLMSPR